jgi:hypothetical protein
MIDYILKLSLNANFISYIYYLFIQVSFQCRYSKHIIPSYHTQYHHYVISFLEFRITFASTAAAFATTSLDRLFRFITHRFLHLVLIVARHTTLLFVITHGWTTLFAFDLAS